MQGSPHVIKLKYLAMAIVSSPPKTVDGKQNFWKISCGGGNWIFSEFSYVKGYLWAGKLGWESENPEISVGGLNPLGHCVRQGRLTFLQLYFESKNHNKKEVIKRLKDVHHLFF